MERHAPAAQRERRVGGARGGAEGGWTAARQRGVGRDGGGVGDAGWAGAGYVARPHRRGLGGIAKYRWAAAGQRQPGWDGEAVGDGQWAAACHATRSSPRWRRARQRGVGGNAWCGWPTGRQRGGGAGWCAVLDGGLA